MTNEAHRNALHGRHRAVAIWCALLVAAMVGAAYASVPLYRLFCQVTGFDVVAALRSDESTRSIPIIVLTSKNLTEEDRRQLNGQVAALFERNSLAGAELIGWLHQLVGI